MKTAHLTLFVALAITMFGAIGPAQADVRFALRCPGYQTVLIHPKKPHQTQSFTFCNKHLLWTNADTARQIRQHCGSGRLVLDGRVECRW